MNKQVRPSSLPPNFQFTQCRPNIHRHHRTRHSTDEAAGQAAFAWRITTRGAALLNRHAPCHRHSSSWQVVPNQRLCLSEKNCARRPSAFIPRPKKVAHLSRHLSSAPTLFADPSAQPAQVNRSNRSTALSLHRATIRLRFRTNRSASACATNAHAPCVMPPPHPAAFPGTMPPPRSRRRLDHSLP